MSNLVFSFSNDTRAVRPWNRVTEWGQKPRKRPLPVQAWGPPAPGLPAFACPPPSSATETGSLVKAEGKDRVWLPHLCIPEAYQTVRHREGAQKNIWPTKPWGTSGYCGNCAFNIKIRSVHSIPIGCSLAFNQVTITEPLQTRPRHGHV